MKKPNYDKTVGKHPVPHAKGIAKDETSDIEKQKKVTEYKEGTNEEE